jgi:hypothetical protein
LTVLAACDGPSITQPAARSMRADRDGGGSFAFAPNARPYGHGMIHWSERWWKWAEGVPLNQNPNVDTVGQTCVNGQRGDVWNLPALVGGTGTVTRACTIPGGKALVVNLSSAWNDYPCPDTSFHPAPGQTLYQFLIQGVAPIVNMATNLSLTVDGQSLANPTAYRFTSDDLAYFTGSTTLQPLDPCITGQRQPAVVDGYFVMVKPLAPGRHTITFSASDPAAGTTTVTYHLTVKHEEEEARAP